jgi:Protein of unknown function (DUF3048) N-terminal domain/Protein of unknown function (DUF3048) C-terminal domain
VGVLKRTWGWIGGWSQRTKVVVASSSVVAAAGLTAGLLLAVIPGHRPAPPPPSPPPPTKPAVPVHTAPPPLRSPFTGERMKKLRTVLAVKIDNIVLARPQTGLTHADIVYVLPVEGGLSRFMAIFSSHPPRVIGPVRSAREDDLQLLRQFRRPAFAWSGAQPQLVPVVERARIADLYANRVGGYYRDNSRIAPYNLYAHTKRLLAEAKAKGASKAHNIGFRFGHAPAGGRARKSASVSYSAASYRFTWSRSKGRWLVWMDGQRAASTEGPQLSAATVVIQRTIVSTSRFLEWPGIRPPYARSIGSGRALVLRDGKAYHVHWSRPHGRDGTIFKTDSGQRMTFARGPVWVVLAPR